MKKDNAKNQSKKSKMKGGENEMLKLKCPRKECSYEWEYNGASSFYTSCPRCKTSVALRKAMIEQAPQQTENVKSN